MKLSDVIYTAITLTLKEFREEKYIDNESVEALAEDLREMFRHYDCTLRGEEWEEDAKCRTDNAEQKAP